MYFKSLHVLNLCGGSTLICRQKFKPPSTIATLPLCSMQQTLNSWNRISSIKIIKALLLKHHQTSCRFILLRLRRILQNSKRCVSRHRRQRWLSHYSCNATNLLGHGFPRVSSKIWSNHEWHIVTPHPPHLPYKNDKTNLPERAWCPTSLSRTGLRTSVNHNKQIHIGKVALRARHLDNASLIFFLHFPGFPELATVRRWSHSQWYVCGDLVVQ